MKIINYSLLSVLLITFFAGPAQTVPRQVKNVFNAKYPEAMNVEWKHEVNDFSATFIKENKLYEASFNNNGDWKKTQKEITLTELPEIIKINLSDSKYANWKIASAYILYFPYIKPKYFVNIIKPDNNQQRLLFTEKGKLIKNNY